MQNDLSNMENDVVRRAENNPTPTGYDTPMKWHKFLIYFLLWLGGIANIFTGLEQCTGGQYGTEAARVYEYFSGLQAIDLLFGFFCMGLGVMQIVTRFKLAHFNAIGPKLLLAAYLVAAGYNLLYPAIVSAVTGISMAELLDIGVIVGNVIMAVLNRIYYSKRAHLFVN